MDVHTVTFFFALLALSSQIGLVLVAGTSLRPGLRATLRDSLRPVLPFFAVTVAAVCMLGSLYLSEVAHFKPCRLCWVQRGFMYPLVLVTLVAALTRGAVARGMRWLALAMAVLGGCVSIYHIAIERNWIEESGSCDPTNPCSLIWVKHLGYVTIPVMALTGFALITASMLGQVGRLRRGSNDDAPILDTAPAA